MMLCRSVCFFLLSAFHLSIPLHASFVFQDTSPKSKADSLLKVAVTLHTSGRYLEAIKTFLLARADTGSANDRFNLGLSYAALNDFERANEFLREAVHLDSVNINYRYQLARFLVQAGAVREGEFQYEEILSGDSTYIPALFSLGLLYNESHSYDEAADMFRRLLALNGNDFLCHYYLGSVLVGLGNQDSASVCLMSCLKLNPTFVPAMNVLASIHYVKKRYVEALALYQQAYSLRPNNADFIYKVGLCYRNLEQYAPATEAFRKAVQLDSLDAQYLGNLGHAYFRVDKYDSSAFAYKRAITIDAENSIWHLNLALALQKLDSIESAANAYRQAILTYHPDAIADIYVKLGNLLFLSKKYHEAIEAYQSALRFDPANRDAQFYIGSAYDDLSDIPEAIRNYTKYLKLAEDISIEMKRREWTNTRLKTLNQLQKLKKK